MNKISYIKKQRTVFKSLLFVILFFTFNCIALSAYKPSWNIDITNSKQSINTAAFISKDSRASAYRIAPQWFATVNHALKNVNEMYLFFKLSTNKQAIIYLKQKENEAPMFIMNKKTRIKGKDIDEGMGLIYIDKERLLDKNDKNVRLFYPKNADNAFINNIFNYDTENMRIFNISNILPAQSKIFARKPVNLEGVLIGENRENTEFVEVNGIFMRKLENILYILSPEEETDKIVYNEVSFGKNYEYPKKGYSGGPCFFGDYLLGLNRSIIRITQFGRKKIKKAREELFFSDIITGEERKKYKNAHVTLLVPFNKKNIEFISEELSKRGDKLSVPLIDAVEVIDNL